LPDQEDDESSWESEYDPTLSPRLARLGKQENLINQSSHEAMSGPRSSAPTIVRGVDASPVRPAGVEGDSNDNSDWVVSSSDESECSLQKPTHKEAEEPLTTLSARATKRVRQSTRRFSGGAHHSLESGDIPSTITPAKESADNRGFGNRGVSGGE
jgi:hypothetical protein